jgi:small-conductance mechanosensitive channel
MSVQQLERSLARLKMETDEKYDALWKRYTKEKEQDIITIAHLSKMLEMEKQLNKHIQEREQLKDDKQKLLDEQNKMRDTLLLSQFNAFRTTDNAGTTDFTLTAKDLREAIVAFESDSDSAIKKARNFVHCAFETLFRIITERRTPSKQDVGNIQTIRSHLTDILDD